MPRASLAPLGVVCVRFCKSAPDGGLSQAAEGTQDFLLVLLQMVHVETAGGFQPVLVHLGRQGPHQPQGDSNRIRCAPPRASPGGEGAVRKALWASASDAVRSNTLLVGRWSIRNTQVAAHGAFEPLPNIPANVGLRTGSRRSALETGTTLHAPYASFETTPLNRRVW
jgi:hypothetical protein